MPEESKEFRGIVRIAGKDLNGKLSLVRALTRIKGIGTNFAETITTVFEAEEGVPKTARVGDLSDQQIEKLEAVLKDPAAHGVPLWQLCDRRDRATGRDTHFTGVDLDLKRRQDIELRKNLRTYHGVRHMYGLPVWGGCTRTRGRTGLTLGVIKKKEMPAKAGKGGEKKEKKRE